MRICAKNEECTCLSFAYVSTLKDVRRCVQTTLRWRFKHNKFAAGHPSRQHWYEEEVCRPLLNVRQPHVRKHRRYVPLYHYKPAPRRVLGPLGMYISLGAHKKKTFNLKLS